jgi:hypothetical protein
MPKGAQPARREEGAYPLPIFNRRATPQDGMHRFPNADVFLGRDTIICRLGIVDKLFDGCAAPLHDVFCVVHHGAVNQSQSPRGLRHRIDASAWLGGTATAERARYTIRTTRRSTPGQAGIDPPTGGDHTMRLATASLHQIRTAFVSSPTRRDVLRLWQSAGG